MTDILRKKSFLPMSRHAASLQVERLLCLGKHNFFDMEGRHGRS